MRIQRMFGPLGLLMIVPWMVLDRYNGSDESPMNFPSEINRNNRVRETGALLTNRTDTSALGLKNSEQTKLKTTHNLEPGDTFNYKGVKLMKLDAKRITDDEIQFVEEQWNTEAKDFLIYSLKINELGYQKYLEVKRVAFQPYDSLINSIEREVKKQFGDAFQIILGEELSNLRDTCLTSYREKLTTLFGADGFSRLEKFQADYSEWVFQKLEVGWNDLR